ncbi:MAG TPA: hypothetical protein VM143_06815 [Acidimicrobiales bacterium]|nr:hypothetical protein [Acidimicrobiales bacterium]
MTGVRVPTTKRHVRLRTARLRRHPDGDDQLVVQMIGALALPWDAARVATHVPAGSFLVLVIAAAVGGALGVIGVVLATACLVGALHRSAPHRRTAAADRALPGVLESVARQLRAGGSLAQALVATTPSPSSGDLAAAWARLAGLVPIVGVTAALDDWSSAAREGHDRGRSVGLAAAALALASSTGGSPARAIDGVAATLRSRLAIADEVRALSSQARASAVVIALAPLVFATVAAATDPRTAHFVASPSGLLLVGLGLGLDALGAWWMARLCRPPILR